MPRDPKSIDWGMIVGEIPAQSDLSSELSTITAALDLKSGIAHTHDSSGIISGELSPDRLPAMSQGYRGAVPATGVPSYKFLRDDGAWVHPLSMAVVDVDGNIVTNEGEIVWAS